MSRELKFRIWDSISQIYYDESDEPVLEFMHEQDGIVLDYNNYSDERVYTIEQFTGLVDKNGKEIFEGDVVAAKYTHYSTQVEARTLPKSIDVRKKDFIAFDENLAAFTLGGTSLCSFDSETEFEVVGNIHENGDLLK